MICARYFYNIFRRVPCNFIWRHRMNGLICIIFQAKPPLNLGRGRPRECHVITPQPIQVSLIMQKHDFGLFNVVRRARHDGRSKHLGVQVIIEGYLKEVFTFGVPVASPSSAGSVMLLLISEFRLEKMYRYNSFCILQKFCWCLLLYRIPTDDIDK